MTHVSRRFVIAGAAALAATPALAAPKSSLISGPWQSFGSSGDPDHSLWAGFLGRYLVPGGKDVARVRYAKAARDGARLTDYLGQMQAVDPTALSKSAAMAYWLNLYNALTIDLVLAEYPVKSIKEVRGGIFNSGPWGDKLVTVAGKKLSLDDIEHGILRPVWKDPRIHYGVNCASIGCPDLDAKPFVSSTLDTRLSALAKRFVTHPRGAKQTNGGAVVSKIYDWFTEDFGGTEQGVLTHINSHRASSLTGPISDYEYDWSLNAA